MRPLFIGLAMAFGLAAPVMAQPYHYRLDTDQSVVGFETDFGQTVIRGRMPVTEADLTLDFERVSASRITVTLSADGARASIPFATEAMRGDAVLAARRFPDIRFESTSVRANGTGTGVTVAGNITIRGVTRAVALDARLFRAADTTPAERDTLAIRLTGSVSRSAFGAVGFADMVGDEVRLVILAHIRRDR